MFDRCAVRMILDVGVQESDTEPSSQTISVASFAHYTQTSWGRWRWNVGGSGEKKIPQVVQQGPQMVATSASQPGSLAQPGPTSATSETQTKIKNNEDKDELLYIYFII